MKKEFNWLKKHKEALEEARYANRHVIADLKRTIKELTKNNQTRRA